MVDNKFYSSLDLNPLKTKKDLLEALKYFLKPVEEWEFSGSTGTCYSNEVVALEGFSRILWALGSGIKTGEFKNWIDKITGMIIDGCNEGDKSFWGFPIAFDQRIVEMPAIAFFLVETKDIIWDTLSPRNKTSIGNWLYSLNGKEIPNNNWEFFKVIVNTCLRLLGCKYNQGEIDHSLEKIDSMYIKSGWYLDSEKIDYYNGFAFHYYGLLYSKLAKNFDTKWSIIFQERANEFAKSYKHFFCQDGREIPFGRSLTYRFATVSFFSACIYADMELLPWGEIKAILLGNLRYWFKNPIFNGDGLLSIGYRYPNLFMSEQYNSPTSPYWAFKTFLLLNSKDDHPFWKAEEVILPKLKENIVMSNKNMIIYPSDGNNRVLLTSGQYNLGYEVNQQAAKYSKFAYSTISGFCVCNEGYMLEKIGCDNNLCLSEDGYYWRVKREILEAKTTKQYIYTKWSPWKDVIVKTFLIPHLNGHIRIHLIESNRPLVFVEGGFSINNETSKVKETITSSEITLESETGERSNIIQMIGKYNQRVLEPIPNLNVLWNRVKIPIIQGNLTKGVNIIGTFYSDTNSKISSRDLPKLDRNNNLLIYKNGNIINFMEEQC
ncbi:DUF2264 domain-containing protein [Thiospirochaeta perfilievii]|uniref:DUF2264 domain-containing protein n=1 Tax=Thiospirochaeta perfilievii TaxID=252967 RepID=UPI00165A0A53|nr:DUF2264 domain-containing protein [Thiospirochaeta perfilievii]